MHFFKSHISVTRSSSDKANSFGLAGGNKGGQKFVKSPQTVAICVAYELKVFDIVPSKIW